MTEDRKVAEAWLRLIEAEPSSTHRDGWVVARCPLGPFRHAKGADHTPSFALRLEPGDSFTNCFACGWHGRASDLALELMALGATGDLGHALNQAQEWATNAPLIPAAPQAPEEVQPWPSWWLTSFPPVKVSADACQYLAERHTPAAIVKLLDLRWDAYRRRIVFPIRDLDGALRGAQGRSIDPAVDLRYLSYKHGNSGGTPVLMGEERIDFDRPVVVVEGPFDMARVAQAYRNVVALTTATISKAKAKRLRWARSVVTMLDQGEAGDHGRKALATHLPRAGVHHVYPPGKDPGDASPYQIAEALDPFVALDEIII